jgi:hypothetical protein
MGDLLPADITARQLEMDRKFPLSPALLRP